MAGLATFRDLYRYNDWADSAVVSAAAGLSDAALDQSFDMGLGSLRATIKHILDGETVWLARWRGRTETPWPSYDLRPTVAALAEVSRATQAERDAFVAALNEADLSRVIVYRDSRGSLFSASLGDMMMQMFVHSTHHRAQAVNMLRRVGATAPELDYMVWVRRPAV